MSDLDPIIHAQARLRIITILTTLAAGDSMAFPKLQELLGMTSGNLATHLRKLEDADYVRVQKVLEGRTPVTYVGVSDEGRTAFRTYKKTLLQLLGSAE